MEIGGVGESRSFYVLGAEAGWSFQVLSIGVRASARALR